MFHCSSRPVQGTIRGPPSGHCLLPKKISPPNLFFDKLLFPSREHRLSCRLCGGRISTQTQSSGWINTSESLVQECHSGASLDHRFLEQECLEQECLTVPERGMAFSTKALPLAKRANRAAAIGGSRPMVCAAGPRPFDRCVRLIRQTASPRQLDQTTCLDSRIRRMDPTQFVHRLIPQIARSTIISIVWLAPGSRKALRNAASPHCRMDWFLGPPNISDPSPYAPATPTPTARRRCPRASPAARRPRRQS